MFAAGTTQKKCAMFFVRFRVSSALAGMSDSTVHHQLMFQSPPFWGPPARPARRRRLPRPLTFSAMSKLIIALFALACVAVAVHGTALDDYVCAPVHVACVSVTEPAASRFDSFPLSCSVVLHRRFKEDSAYAWVDTGLRLNGTGLRGDSWTGYVLNMTSQRWLTDADFAPNSPSKSLWWHYLVVIVPNAVQWTRNASLYITGGDNDHGGQIPKSNDEDIVRIFSNISILCIFSRASHRWAFSLVRFALIDQLFQLHFCILNRHAL
jgi:hypothetical protein